MLAKVLDIKLSTPKSKRKKVPPFFSFFATNGKKNKIWKFLIQMRSTPPQTSIFGKQENFLTPPTWNQKSELLQEVQLSKWGRLTFNKCFIFFGEYVCGENGIQKWMCAINTCTSLIYLKWKKKKKNPSKIFMILPMHL